jgi:hypothetical protein
MTLTVSHDALATAFDEVRAEAPHHEVDGLQQEVDAFLDGFLAHVGQERARRRRLPSSGACPVDRRQEQLHVDVVTPLAEVGEESTVDACRCASPSEGVVVRLTLQPGTAPGTSTGAGWVTSLPSDR